MNSHIDNTAPIELQLLAPARSVEIAYTAIACGADAVYIGGPDHGARASATNSIDDIAKLCKYAHIFRVKVYVALNTLVYDNEIYDVEQTINLLYAAGVDALIIQDLGILRMHIPPISLHASTQCDARTPQRAKFLQDLGFDCVVVPREASLDEIRAFRAQTDVTLEAFVHGALCVSYSGDCRASFINGGRSANRGECAQICRLPYNLIDSVGNIIQKNKYLLSLKDLNRLSRLAELVDAGITIFKIEGRLKNADYVATVVSEYSEALNDICKNSNNRFKRSSNGVVRHNLSTDINKVFNRGFTQFFTDGLLNVKKNTLSANLTPKWPGEYVGKSTHADKKSVSTNSKHKFSNGDGITFFDKNGKLCGFRVNRAEGGRLFTSTPVNIPPGTALYRNNDVAYSAQFAAIAERKMPVKFYLEHGCDYIALTVTDQLHRKVTVVETCNVVSAKTSQKVVHHRIIVKLGNTPYFCDELIDSSADIFVPANMLTNLRRQAVEQLQYVTESTYRYSRRKEEYHGAAYSMTTQYSGAMNVSNKLAKRLYNDHGVASPETAAETTPVDSSREIRVMTTRYCLRRELGICKKTASGADIIDPLYLVPTSTTTKVRRMRIDFDCRECCMNIFALPD